MYIAQHLITIDKAFQAKFSQLPAGVVGGQNDLGRLISKVKRLGNEAFSEHIAVKRAQLSQHLGGVDGEGHATRTTQDDPLSLKPFITV